MNALLIASAWAFAAQSQPTVGQWEHLSASTRDVYAFGVIVALGWANADLRHRGYPPLYCPPERLAITSDQIESIVRDFSDDPSNAVSRDDDWAMIALTALQYTFPCPEAELPTA